MYLQCLSHKVDIVCGDDNQSWCFRSKTHKTERTYALGNCHPEPLIGLINTVARLKFPVFDKGQPLFDRVCMEYVDNNAYAVKSCPESQYNMWDCCFIQIFSYGKTHMIMTVKGQQRGISLVKPMRRLFKWSGRDTTWISGSRCRVRGLLFLPDGRRDAAAC